MTERSLHALALLAGVSLLKRRELGIPPGRCPTCAQRRDWVVITDDEPLPAADGPCPRCEWRPEVIHVVHVDGAQWHQHQNDSTADRWR